MPESPQRRNPLRLIVSKETQLHILWWVWIAIFSCMVLSVTMVNFRLQWIWVGVLLLALGTLLSIWVSRKIAGPLYRIEKDLESMLKGDSSGTRVHLRQGDPLQHLAELVNQLMERSQKK